MLKVQEFAVFWKEVEKPRKSASLIRWTTPGITHKISDKNSLVSSNLVPRNENEISWEFLNNFFDNF
jgi:hypothetical protein